MAGGLKLNQLETVSTIRESDLMLLDTSIGTGKITIAALRKYYNIDEMQNNVTDAVNSVVQMAENVKNTMDTVKDLEAADDAFNRSITAITGDLDTLKGDVQNLDTDKQDKQDQKLVTTNKNIVDAINELHENIVTGLSDKQSNTDDNLQTIDKTIVGAINEIRGKIPSIVNNLTSGGYDKALSAEQGRVLDTKISNTQNNINNLWVNAKTRGARADGSLHSIQEIFPSVQLLEVQALDPNATLNDEADWYVLQTMINEGIKNIYLGEGQYSLSRPLVIDSPNIEIKFHNNSSLNVLIDSAIAAIQLGSSTTPDSATNVNGVRIHNPRIKGNNVGTGIEVRVCGTDNKIINPVVNGFERGIQFRVKGAFDNNTIVNPHITNCALAIDDSLAGFNDGLVIGGVIKDNSRLGLASASWGTKFLGTNISSNAGAEIKVIGSYSQLTMDNCRIHHVNPDSGADNNTSACFLFDPSWSGIINMTNCITSETGTGYVFKEESGAIASGNIFITGGTCDNYQMFFMPNSSKLAVSINSKYDLRSGMQPIRTGVHAQAIIQLTNANGEFESIHAKQLKLEPTDSTTNAAAINITCGSYVPWSTGSTGVGKLKGSIHINTQTAIVYIRTLEAVGSDAQGNWKVLFNGGV